MDDVKSLALPSVFWNSSMRDFTSDDIQRMAQSLRVHGQIQPIVVKPMNGDGEYEGVCGRLRYEGAKYAHIAEVLARIHEFKCESDVRAWELAENLHRKDLTATQKAESYEELYESYKKELGGVKGKEIVSTIAQTQQDFSGEKQKEPTIWEYLRVARELPKEVKKKTMLEHSFGVKHALQLLRLKDEPEKQLEVTEKFVESSIQGKPISVVNFKKEIDEILNPPKEPGPLPEGEYSLIYADPPWRYHVKHLRGNPEKYYASMGTEEICALEVPVAEDAVLFLWTTNAHLEDALKVMKAWGFQYKTNIAWVKDKFGTGFYVRGQHELLLIGIKGDTHPPEQPNRPPSILNAPIREHSQKPEETYEIIEQMYPNSRFLELFARNGREGWESWGNEV